MYAVIRTGGKQYRVQKDDVIKIERIAGEAGETVELDQVLMIDDGKGPTLGAPLVEGARVAATVLDQARGEKVLVFKKKRRKAYRRLRGHRQDLTVLRITDILASAGGGRRRRAAAKPAPEPEAPELPVPEATGPQPDEIREES